MAATFAQALVDAYGSIGGLPTLWGEQIADSVSAYPRAELNILAQQPYYAHEGSVEKEECRASFTVWHTSLASLETLCTSIMDALTPTSLAIDGKKSRLWRTNYRPSISQERTANQLPVFMATIEYQAEVI